MKFKLYTPDHNRKWCADLWNMSTSTTKRRECTFCPTV